MKISLWAQYSNYPYQRSRLLSEAVLDALDQRSPASLAPGTGFVEDSFSVAGGDDAGGNESDGERWGVAAEASLAHRPPTSCFVARLLTGGGPIPVCSLGVGDPCSRPLHPPARCHRVASVEAVSKRTTPIPTCIMHVIL